MTEVASDIETVVAISGDEALDNDFLDESLVF